MNAKTIEILITLLIIITSSNGFLQLNPNYKLQQVVIIGRHNMRVPLNFNLERLTPNEWPKWDKNPGELTEKGAEKERNLGKAFGKWFRKVGILEENCPSDAEFYVYSNSLNRTVVTAKAFADNVFPNCQVAVHHVNDSNDLVFDTNIYNSSLDFLNKVKEAMDKRLNESKFDEALKLLDKILNVTESDLCKVDKICSLNNYKNFITNIAAGSAPSIQGGLRKANGLMDNFFMQFYDFKKVAWGHINKIKDFEPLFQITKAYRNILYCIKFVAIDLSKNLMEKFEEIVLDENSPKVYVIVGHDTNLMTMMTALEVKPFVLKDQIESSPVGSKIVFQKWHDKYRNIDLLKVDYVYQRVDKFNDESSGIDTEPYSVSLKLKGCIADAAGFCLWSDFIKTLPEYPFSYRRSNEAIGLHRFSALGFLLVSFVLLLILF